MEYTRATTALLISLFGFLFSGCSVAVPKDITSPAVTSPRTAAPTNGVAWNNIRTWMRQDNGFPNCKLDEVAQSHFELVTVSPYCEGKLWPATEVQKAKDAGKWVLSYVDISRVATWERRIWGSQVKADSSFISGKPSSWGAYSVMVDHPGWWNALKTILDDDLKRGYHGFFLDDCAGYWEEQGYFDPISKRQVTGGATPELRAKYAGLVRKIREYLNSVRPGTKLICNGDGDLVSDDIGDGNGVMKASRPGRTGYVGALDGVVYEGRVYHAPNANEFGVETSAGRRDYTDRWFKPLVTRGKGVFVLDYTKVDWQQRRSWSEARTLGFVPSVNIGNRLPLYMSN
jgi:uncharacterized protein (TIGR01370 family)